MNKTEIETKSRKNIEAYKQAFKAVENKPDCGSYTNNPIITSLIYAAFGLLLGTVFYLGV